MMSATLAWLARPVLDFRIRNWSGSLLMGVAVFAIWIGPDRIFPGYHAHWLFSNPVTGAVSATLAESSRGDAAVLTLRTLRAAVFVPIAEELFWRGWLMRWLISPEFKEVPLGAWSARAFWIVAVLFAPNAMKYPFFMHFMTSISGCVKSLTRSLRRNPKTHTRDQRRRPRTKSPRWLGSSGGFFILLRGPTPK